MKKVKEISVWFYDENGDSKNRSFYNVDKGKPFPRKLKKGFYICKAEHLSKDHDFKQIIPGVEYRFDEKDNYILRMSEERMDDNELEKFMHICDNYLAIQEEIQEYERFKEWRKDPESDKLEFLKNEIEKEYQKNANLENQLKIEEARLNHSVRSYKEKVSILEDANRIIKQASNEYEREIDKLECKNLELENALKSVHKVSGFFLNYSDLN